MAPSSLDVTKKDLTFDILPLFSVLWARTFSWNSLGCKFTQESVFLQAEARQWGWRGQSWGRLPSVSATSLATVGYALPFWPLLQLCTVSSCPFSVEHSLGFLPPLSDAQAVSGFTTNDPSWPPANLSFFTSWHLYSAAPSLSLLNCSPEFRDRSLSHLSFISTEPRLFLSYATFSSSGHSYVILLIA